MINTHHENESRTTHAKTDVPVTRNHDHIPTTSIVNEIRSLSIAAQSIIQNSADTLTVSSNGTVILTSGMSKSTKRNAGQTTTVSQVFPSLFYHDTATKVKSNHAASSKGSNLRASHEVASAVRIGLALVSGELFSFSYNPSSQYTPGGSLATWEYATRDSCDGTRAPTLLRTVSGSKASVRPSYNTIRSPSSRFQASGEVTQVTPLLNYRLHLVSSTVR